MRLEGYSLMLGFAVWLTSADGRSQGYQVITGDDGVKRIVGYPSKGEQKQIPYPSRDDDMRRPVDYQDYYDNGPEPMGYQARDRAKAGNGFIITGDDGVKRRVGYDDRDNGNVNTGARDFRPEDDDYQRPMGYQERNRKKGHNYITGDDGKRYYVNADRGYQGQRGMDREDRNNDLSSLFGGWDPDFREDNTGYRYPSARGDLANMDHGRAGYANRNFRKPSGYGYAGSRGGRFQNGRGAYGRTSTANRFDWQRTDWFKEKSPSVEIKLETFTDSVFVRVQSPTNFSSLAEGYKYLESKGFWHGSANRDLESALMTDASLGLIDIGAEIGAYSVTGADLKRTVLAVESNPVLIELFQQSVIRNRQESLVTLLVNTVSYYREERHEEDRQGKSLEELGKEAITLDDLVGQANIQAAVLRINLKEHVLRSLFHSEMLFARVHIPFVFMTWSDIKGTEEAQFVVEFFTRKRYLPKMYAGAEKSLQMDCSKWNLGNQTYVVWQKK